MKLVRLLCSPTLLAATSRANDINLRGQSGNDDASSPKDINILVDEIHSQKMEQAAEDLYYGSQSAIDSRELQVRRRGGLFNPPKSSGLFNPPPADQQQQQQQQEQQEEVTTATTTTISARAGNIFFAARSATSNMLQLAEGSDSGYLLAWGPSMTEYTVICQDGDCDSGCPGSCEVPRTAILRGLIWWIGVDGPTDPNLKKTEYEVKNDKDRVAKGSMKFEGNNQAGSSIWSFEVDLGSDSDVIPHDEWQQWDITAKQKIEDQDKEKLQTDKFELTITDEAPPPPPPLTPEPSDRPSSPPSREPSTEPTLSRSPSEKPSVAPSFLPSNLPSSEPSNPPTPESSPSPSKSPQPSAYPSQMPSKSPTKEPSDIPSSVPSTLPSSEPSDPPTPEASSPPSKSPQPSSHPSQMPSEIPSGSPSKAPSPKPTETQDTFIGEGDEGYVLGYKKTESSDPVILCGTPIEVGVPCDDCPGSCEVPEDTILWGAMWNTDLLNGLDVTDQSYDPSDPTTHNDFNDIVKDYNVEVKVNGDREGKPDLEFDSTTNSWYFEIPLASVNAALGDKINAKMKLKREDKDVDMTTDPDRVEFTIVPNYVFNYDLVGFAGITTDEHQRQHCEAGATGGQGGGHVTVSVGDEEIFYDYASRSTGKYVILVDGMLGPPPTCTSGADHCNDKPFYRIASDKSILGLGSGSGFSGAGLRIDGNKFTTKDKNIVIRNINIENAPNGFDGIGIQDGAECIWIDHCSFSKPSPGTDGALDIKNGSDYITISWNIFRDYQVVPDNNDDNDFRAMLIGSSNDEVGDKDDLHVTLHHNRFVNCDQRLPRVRFSELVHVYNNYYENVGSYAIGSAMGAYVLVEGNYFDNVEDPIDTCVGTDSGGTPGEPGFAAERDNVYKNSPPSGSCHANINFEDLDVLHVPPYDYFVDSSVPDITRLGAGTGKIVCGNDGLCS